MKNKLNDSMNGERVNLTTVQTMKLQLHKVEIVKSKFNYYINHERTNEYFTTHSSSYHKIINFKYLFF